MCSPNTTGANDGLVPRVGIAVLFQYESRVLIEPKVGSCGAGRPGGEHVVVTNVDGWALLSADLDGLDADDPTRPCRHAVSGSACRRPSLGPGGGSHHTPGSHVKSSWSDRRKNSWTVVLFRTSSPPSRGHTSESSRRHSEELS